MGLVLPALFIFWQCTKDEPLPVAPGTEEVTPNPDPTPDPTPDPQPEPGKDRVIPSDLRDLPRVYIDTPGHVGVSSKEDWVESVSVKILGDGNELLLEDSGSKIRGRGNSTWDRYPKKPYYIKLGTKADLYGTGKSKKWVLLANWMDRTLLRNQVAFHAASLTSLDWTPSGGFVELYLDGKDLGIYWLG
ncbi:MAG: CotH kinase family protein, partial [Bacteroidales bacterium]|nr:CotH kinase family protein [Bacteroidales bacterium]